MKKSILLALLCIALILLAGCADLEERQAKELEFNEDNYTYEETINQFKKTNKDINVVVKKFVDSKLEDI